MVEIELDGQKVEIAEGSMVMHAAEKAGTYIPHFCYHKKLSIAANCRMCLVDVEKAPKPMPACATPVTQGMIVRTKSDKAIQAQKSVMEFLLINHPLDCPICDQAGECDLQNLAFEHGTSKTRYEEERRTYDKIDIGPNIQLHMDRCILCYRCVYTADQFTDNRVHGVLHRGDSAEIGTYIQNSIDNDFSGNVIDVCPVGALTDKTFRFKSRVWFLNPFDAHRDCPTCSGKVVVWKFGEDIYRVTGRKDQYGEVEEFICNTCRFEKKAPEDWTIEGPRKIDRHSVISQNHYEDLKI
ncbi:MAG: (2Fe-2S)-binding protein [Saprospiraceae bacterium]|nr:(2Fe-2S)-binding protein [Saprospiraceae bacterium]